MTMQEITGLDRVFIGDGYYTEHDLRTMPIDRLEELKLAITAKHTEITTETKIYEISGPTPDHDKTWYVQAKRTQGVYQRLIPYINNLSRQRTRLGRSIEGYFMDVAREQFDPEDFNAVLEEAKRRHEEQSKGA